MKQVVSLMLVFAAAGCSKSLNIGKEYIPANAQINVLQELAAKTADIGIMDSVMAEFYMTTGSYKNSLMIVEDIYFSNERYVIAARKGALDTIAQVNEALIVLTKDGTVGRIAEKYGLTSELQINRATTSMPYSSVQNKSDWEYIVGKGSIKIGYTLFAPIAYFEDNSTTLVGFDIDLARAAAAKFGLKPEFVEINWDAKETELAAKNIDLIWNGMTHTQDRAANMALSLSYLRNRQVAVIRVEDKDKYSAVNMSEFIRKAVNAKMAAESGSAGENVIVDKK